MIPTRVLIDWRPRAPWPDEDQVEQDLVLTRALITLFDGPAAQLVALRGGTALHKLVLPEPGRYSEDIDLVQRTAGPIKPVVAAIQEALDPWLGPPATDARRDAFRLVYRYDAEASGARRRLKIEINTREHEPFGAWRPRTLACETRWFTGTAAIVTFEDEELLATKLRALYQRRKGRDLYDLGVALERLTLDDDRVVDLFARYLARQGLAVSGQEMEANVAQKLGERLFTGDIGPLLRIGEAFDITAAADRLRKRLIAKLK